uniref:Mitochondrial fission factor n=1 Tax=Periophthalmus magnuspinnatus TaxID=409849 RepID=A0A3B4AJ35_9GOBI
MSAPAFAPPSGDVAEMNRIHYELEYTEGISQRMRIPDTLKVASESQVGPLPLQQPLPPTTIMQVPERIIVAGQCDDPRFSRPRDLDLIQSVPQADLLNMKAPPRVLTLSEQPLDSLETEETRAPHSRSRRERSVSDNISSRHGSQLTCALCSSSVRPKLAHSQSLLQGGLIVKLNRRLQVLEEENKERSKREVVLYSATVAFWLINTWIWFRR